MTTIVLHPLLAVKGFITQFFLGIKDELDLMQR